MLSYKVSVFAEHEYFVLLAGWCGSDPELQSSTWQQDILDPAFVSQLALSSHTMKANWFLSFVPIFFISDKMNVFLRMW